jgi:hypothetical protein
MDAEHEEENLTRQAAGDRVDKEERAAERLGKK